MIGTIHGDSPWWEDDYNRWKSFSVSAFSIGVNRKCEDWMDCCVSQHSDYFPSHINISNYIPVDYFRGTSGLHACWYALECLKLDKIVLIGMPISDPYNHQFVIRCWERFKDNYGNRVRSVSYINGEDSLTTNLFTKPTKEFLHG